MRDIIDVHAHVTLPSYAESLTAAGVPLPGYRPGGGAGPAVKRSAGIGDEAGIRQRLELMNEAGVARQVLSPTVGPYAKAATDARRAARLVNTAHADIVARHPDRFSFFAALPLPHVDDALAELEHAFDEFGAMGAIIHCSVGGLSIADPSFEPVLAELDRRGSVLFIHPAVNGLCSPLVNDWGLAPTAGTVFEDTVAALHLITRQVPARFPRIEIVVPHLGGALPMLLARLDKQLPVSVPDLPEPPSTTARRFWYDTVCHGSSTALRAAVEAFGPDRILAGSDYPVMLPFETYAETMARLGEANLPPVAMGAILRTNAEALLGLERFSR